MEDKLKNESYKSIINFCRKDSALLKEILTKTTFLDKYSPTLTERIYCIKNNIFDRPVCRYCGSDVKFISQKEGYKSWCSNKDCVNKHKKQTCLEKYGTDCITKSSYFKDKSKETMMNKYGTTHITQSDYYKEKYKQTCLEKYGTEHFSSTKEYKEKYKQTCLEKYGVDNVRKSDIVKDKITNTLLDRYGVKRAIQLEKNKKSIVEGKHKYVINLYKDMVESGNSVLLDYNNQTKILKCQCKKCNEIYEINNQYLRHRITNKWGLCPHCYNHQYETKIETNLIEDIKKFFDGQIIKRHRFSRKDGGTYEADILIPSKNLAIECNGLYWHSELFKDKYYHQEKKKCIENEYGYNLIQLWEDDLNDKEKYSIIISRLKEKLGVIENKIYARKCQIKEVSGSLAKKFLDKNHLQKYAPSTINIGLFHDSILVAIATFGKQRKLISGDRNGYELVRFCTQMGYSIVGGFSKLITYFTRRYSKNLYSYVDLDWVKMNDNSYNKIGFKTEKITEPNYMWVVDGIRRNRLNYTKSHLVKMGMDKNKTERELMYSKKYYRIFGSGNLLVKY